MLLFTDSREKYEKRFCLRHSDGGFIGDRPSAKWQKLFRSFDFFSVFVNVPTVTVHVIEYLSCLSFYIREYSTFISASKNTSKLIKMTSAGFSRMFAMIILFIFQFQIATSLIKYAVRFLQAREGRGKKAMQTR